MRHLARPSRRPGGFTLIELLTVMTIIAILAALVLSISGYANKKAALARAQGEIQALSAACESYKTDNGTYPYQVLASGGTIPSTSGTYPPSDQLDPRTNGNSTYSTGGQYANASLELYEALSGDLTLNGTGGGPSVKNYITDLRQDVFGRGNMNAVVSSSNQVEYLSDPFGNCYGYSTANSTAIRTGSNYTGQSYSPPTTCPGYNPTFDLWSTGGSISTPASTPGSTGDPALGWVKNW
jgi:prepilin-type N-terminal cleavage/methylation domain-containing protein